MTYLTTNNEGIRRVLDKIAKPIHRKVVELTKRFGFQVRVFFPTTDGGVYGVEDSSYKFNDNPNIQGVFLITGVLINSSATQTLGLLDPFFEEGVKMWITDMSIADMPNGSMVEVDIKDNKFFFKIINCRNILGGEEHFLDKYFLAPMV